MFWFLAPFAVTAATAAYFAFFKGDSKDSKNNSVATAKEIVNNTIHILAGYLISSKGKVTHQDVDMIEVYLDDSKIYGKEREKAYVFLKSYKEEWFNFNKIINDVSIEKKLTQTDKSKICEKLTYLLSQCCEGELTPTVLQKLKLICSKLGYSTFTMLEILKMHAKHSDSRCKETKGTINLAGGIQEAYKILQLPEYASQKEAKESYKNLIRHYHPDKYVKHDADMKELARNKLNAIHSAWDCLRKHNNWE